MPDTPHNLNNTTPPESHHNVISFPAVAGGNGFAVQHRQTCRPLMPGDRVIINGGINDGRIGMIVQTGMVLDNDRSFSVQLSDKTIMATARDLERV